MEKPFNPESFTPFLESIKSPPKAIWSGSMISILKALAESEEGGMDTGNLVSKVELPIESLASDLKQLEAQQLVTRGLKNGREFVSLTESGKSLLNAKI
jgi:predicted transcriptional regulator